MDAAGDRSWSDPGCGDPGVAGPDVRVFRLVAAAVLLPIGVWLTVRAIRPCRAAARPTLPPARVSVLGGVVGVAGGSLLAPIVVATGLSVAAVAQAALSATRFVVRWQRQAPPITRGSTVGIEDETLSSRRLDV